MGLAARFLEEKGFSTVVLTPTWEFNRAVGIPRQVAVEYPYGRPVGQVGDVQGQKKILLDALSFLKTAEKPGSVRHLPYRWPEPPKDTHWHPPEMSPIIAANLQAIKKARKKG
ncbi:MAG: hypothetical protein K9K88_05830 [Desulfobacterales bacterium]|nr:hypothetical protein [Desulfobacterales bacterium]